MLWGALRAERAVFLHRERIDNGPVSAWRVIHHILKRYVKDGRDEVVLDLLDQLVRNKWKVEKTAVGQEVLEFEEGPSLSIKKRPFMYRILATVFNLR